MHELVIPIDVPSMVSINNLWFEIICNALQPSRDIQDGQNIKFLVGKIPKTDIADP